MIEAEAAARSNAEEKSIMRWSVEKADLRKRVQGRRCFVSIQPVDGVLGILESAKVEIGGSKV